MTVLEEQPRTAHPWYRLQEAVHSRQSAPNSTEFVRAQARERVLRRQLEEREFTPKMRARAEEKGHAMEGGRYPIVNATDLAAAIKAFGRGAPADKAAIKRHIIKRARALGLEKQLPAGWTSDGG